LPSTVAVKVATPAEIVTVGRGNPSQVALASRAGLDLPKGIERFAATSQDSSGCSQDPGR